MNGGDRVRVGREGTKTLSCLYIPDSYTLVKLGGREGEKDKGMECGRKRGRERRREGRKGERGEGGGEGRREEGRRGKERRREGREGGQFTNTTIR